MDGNDNSRESPSQQNQMDRERIATLLRNAIQLVGLNSGSNWGSMNTSEQSQPTGLGQLQLDRAPRPTSPSHMSINGMPSRRIPSGESAHTAFSRCFPAARGIPNPTGRRKRAASTRFPAPYFVPPTTWTHEFFLLSKSSARHTPERSQIDTMQKAGLGRCKVVFEDKRGDHAHVRATLEKYYPKLASQNGAFSAAKMSVRWMWNTRIVSYSNGSRWLSCLFAERSMQIIHHLHKANANKSVNGKCFA
eukprot:gene723-23262_t